MNDPRATLRPLEGEHISRDSDDTARLGEKIAARLAGGEVILLDGVLGAGKTALVKAVMHGLGFDPSEVTSPTFTLVNRYDARLTIYHLDLYRLDAGAHAAARVDLDELLTDEQAVLFIEWAERLGSYPLPPAQTWRIRIDGEGDEPRRIRITSSHEAG